MTATVAGRVVPEVNSLRTHSEHEDDSGGAEICVVPPN